MTALDYVYNFRFIEQSEVNTTRKEARMNIVQKNKTILFRI